ncbi:hypothetical protein Tco_1196720, partial [Tanacetum coccineum]
IQDTTEMGKSFNTAIRFTRCVATIYYGATRMNEAFMPLLSLLASNRQIALALSTVEGYPGYGVKQGENVVNVVVQDGSNFDRVFDMEGRCSMKERWLMQCFAVVCPVPVGKCLSNSPKVFDPDLLIDLDRNKHVVF